MEFHQKLYTPAIHKIAFHLPHVQIIGIYYCGNTCREAFQSRAEYQYVLCRKYYEELVVVSFSHQIKSEYYDDMRSVAIYVITL